MPEPSAAKTHHLSGGSPIHHEYFPDNYPAWTAVGTTALLQPGAPVEMRAMAILGSGRNPRVGIPQPRARTVKPQPSEQGLE